MHEDLAQLITLHSVAFGPFGSGVAQRSIDRAERELGIKLPPSYKWWLLNYGGGQIQGDIVYGIDEVDEDRPDVVRLAARNRKRGRLDPDRLVFVVGNEELFYFNTAFVDQQGEFSAYWLDTDQAQSRLFADNFAGFLRRRIKELYK